MVVVVVVVVCVCVCVCVGGYYHSLKFFLRQIRSLQKGGGGIQPPPPVSCVTKSGAVRRGLNTFDIELTLHLQLG